jgi:hypothetical protein
VATTGLAALVSEESLLAASVLTDAGGEVAVAAEADEFEARVAAARSEDGSETDGSLASCPSTVELKDPFAPEIVNLHEAV